MGQGRLRPGRPRLLVANPAHTLYPPDIDASGRRALQFYRLWPVLSAVAALATLVTVNGWADGAAISAVVVVYAAGVALGFAATDTLRAMDSLSSRRLITRRDYQARWATLYDAMPSRP